MTLQGQDFKLGAPAKCRPKKLYLSINGILTWKRCVNFYLEQEFKKGIWYSLQKYQHPEPLTVNPKLTVQPARNFKANLWNGSIDFSIFVNLRSQSSHFSINVSFFSLPILISSDDIGSDNCNSSQKNQALPRPKGTFVRSFELNKNIRK